MLNAHAQFHFGVQFPIKYSHLKSHVEDDK